ncbi:MAG: hypothetical protein OXH36_05260 [Bdellovibrionales bacterium]|nr:hypothetical protein [Bdellovibrionales bacterium]
MSKIKIPKFIKEEKVLFVEGKDEETFFTVLLKKYGLQEIQIIQSGGKEQFSFIFPEIIKIPGFSKIRSLAVIQDADKSTQAVFQSVCYTLEKENLGIPGEISHFTSTTPQVGIFTLPDGKNSGNLESLCLSTVQSENITDCIEPFINCVKQKTSVKNTKYKFPRNLNKAKCKAFLSAMEEDTSALGIAAEKGYWNLDSDKLNPVLDFLKKLDREN